MRIFSDESCVTSNDGEYLIIGALSCDQETAKAIRKAIQKLNIEKNKKSEYHFTKVGDKRGNVKNYQDFCDIFLQFYQQKRSYQTGLEIEKMYRRLCFDALLVKHEKIDHLQFSQGDIQMGFFRFYYSLLAQTIQKYYSDQQDIVITIDKIDLKKPDLITNLHQRLNNIIPVKSLNPQNSTAEPLLQLADVITGMISFRWNRWEQTAESNLSKRNQSKREVIEYFEGKLGFSLRNTTYAYRSFNIWELDLQEMQKTP